MTTPQVARIRPRAEKLPTWRDQVPGCRQAGRGADRPVISVISCGTPKCTAVEHTLLS